MTGLPTGNEKTQPWKSFWPPDTSKMSEDELRAQPWLTWSPDPSKPHDKPWRRWMKENNAVTSSGTLTTGHLLLDCKLEPSRSQ